MKTINNYIQEALITKNTKLRQNIFAEEYVIFLPYDDNYYYMARKYPDKEINAMCYTIYLIKKSEAINIYNELPNKHLTTFQEISKGLDSSLLIYRIPTFIKSELDLHRNIDSYGYYDSPFNPINKIRWDLIENLNELK